MHACKCVKTHKNQKNQPIPLICRHLFGGEQIIHMHSGTLVSSAMQVFGAKIAITNVACIINKIILKQKLDKTPETPYIVPAAYKQVRVRRNLAIFAFSWNKIKCWNYENNKQSEMQYCCKMNFFRKARCFGLLGLLCFPRGVLSATPEYVIIVEPSDNKMKSESQTVNDTVGSNGDFWREVNGLQWRRWMMRIKNPGREPHYPTFPGWRRTTRLS